MKTEAKYILIASYDELRKLMNEIIDNEPNYQKKQLERKRFNRAQAAKFCGISYHTFGKWAKDGKFQERGFGRKKFYYEDELIQALTRAKR